MERSESIKELSAALAKAQNEIGKATRNETNGHFENKYSTLDAVWDACRPALSSQGLSVVQMPLDADPGRVALETVLLHSSGEFIVSRVSTKLFRDDAQGVGSALTYLRRYALSAMVGVVSEHDDDGNAASQPPRNAPRQQQRQPSPKENPYRDAFVDSLDAALSQHEFGVATAYATNKINGMLKQKYKVSLDDITPEIGKKVIEAVAAGKFDALKTEYAKQQTEKAAKAKKE